MRVLKRSAQCINVSVLATNELLETAFVKQAFKQFAIRNRASGTLRERNSQLRFVTGI